MLPSQANFVLATVPSGRGKEMYLGLKEQGILVRYFDLPGLRDKLRITIGQSHENNALLAGIKMLEVRRRRRLSRKTWGRLPSVLLRDRGFRRFRRRFFPDRL